MKKCYIYTAKLKDFPTVRIQSKRIPFESVESCITWCNRHTISYIIKEWTNKSPFKGDKTIIKKGTKKRYKEV